MSTHDEGLVENVVEVMKLASIVSMQCGDTENEEDFRGRYSVAVKQEAVRVLDIVRAYDAAHSPAPAADDVEREAEALYAHRFSAEVEHGVDWAWANSDDNPIGSIEPRRLRDDARTAIEAMPRRELPDIRDSVILLAAFRYAIGR